MVKFIIKNFQSIEEARIAVDGFTLLVGSSSSGKSACLRAIQAALTNRFRSGQVREVDGVPVGNAEISVLFPDSTPLRVVKSPEGSPTMTFDGSTYSKLSRTVPGPIASMVNMSPLQDNYSLNFHPQFEKPLLLEFSQRKVLDLLSTSTALDDLHLAKDALLTKRAENRGAFTSISSILDSLNEKHSKLAALVEDLTPLQTKLDSLASEYESLEPVMNDLVSLQELLAQDVTEHMNLETRLIHLIESLPDATDLLSLQELLGTSYDKQIEENLTRVNVYSKVLSLKESIKELEVQESYAQSLVSLKETADSITNPRIHQLEHVINDNICPICGTSLSEHRIESHDRL